MRLRHVTTTLAISAALVAGGASTAAAQEEAPPNENWQEYPCTEGILGTGIACSRTGPDPWDGTPVASDSDAANALRFVLGGGLFRPSE